MDLLSPVATDRKWFTTTSIKWIAMITMVIDHVGALFGYTYSAADNMYKMSAAGYIFRCIGRISFPLFAFLIVQGVLHTHNWKRYLLRLGIFAIISEIPFDLAFADSMFYWASQNVMFTLCLGAAILVAIRELEKNKDSVPEFISIILQFLLMAIGCAAAWILKFDYEYAGIITIVALYYFRNNMFGKVGSIMMINIWILNQSSIQSFACLALIPILFYNGKIGGLAAKRQNNISETQADAVQGAVAEDAGKTTIIGGWFKLQYLYYLIYPVHLIILHFIAVIVYKY